MSDRLRAGLVFCGMFCVVMLLFGNRLVLGTADEGIYLEGAQRLLQGQKLYVDFFGYMSPGSYWVQELSFRLFGLTMTAGRIPVLIYFSLSCALLYWLAARLSSRVAAALAVLLYFLFETAQSASLTAQHRWDSGAISLLAVAVAVYAQDSQNRWWIAVAGALSVLAAIFTPSVALVGIATFLWLLAWRPGRRLVLPFAAGCAVMTAALAIILWAGGILSAFIGQMLWLSRNYSAVNVMPYGAIIGGYRDLIKGGPSLEWIIRVGIVICLALPAILPVLSALGWSAAMWRHRRNAPEVIYLLICMAALIASAYPRQDVAHLAFIAALPYALGTALIARYLPRRAGAAVFGCVLFIGVMFGYHSAAELLAERRIQTPVGVVRLGPEEIPEVEALLKSVHPGDTVFVHPYQPLLYFLTQARNPTRYCYLAPGMMTEADELVTLQGLEQSPPKWIMHLDIAPEEFARVFPSSDPSTLQYKSIEYWIHQKYSVPDSQGITVVGYTLLKGVSADRLLAALN